MKEGSERRRNKGIKKGPGLLKSTGEFRKTGKKSANKGCVSGREKKGGRLRKPRWKTIPLTFVFLPKEEE